MKISKKAVRPCFFFLLIFLLSIPSLSLNAQQPELGNVKVTRLSDRPLIGPGIHPSVGINIQGPSMIKVPEWVSNRLGNYYLYFADHKGLYIRLAYADNIIGPWQIHEPGSMKIEDSFFATTRPPIAEERLAELVASREASGVRVVSRLCARTN